MSEVYEINILVYNRILLQLLVKQSAEPRIKLQNYANTTYLRLLQLQLYNKNVLSAPKVDCIKSTVFSSLLRCLRRNIRVSVR
jgi:hypothetical protein